LVIEHWVLFVSCFLFLVTCCLHIYLIEHNQEMELIFNRACEVLKLRDFSFRTMQRGEPVKDLKRRFVLGHTSFKTKTVTVDIYTAKKRQSKKISAILAVIAHELAHHQKPPYRQRWRGRIINRIHFPQFYRQVNRNVAKFKKDKVLGEYYSSK